MFICTIHNEKLTCSRGWYGQKVECSSCLAAGIPMGDFVKKPSFDLERWEENREFRYFTAEERAFVPEDA